jgi:cobalt/nickel transport system permease protein
LWDGSLTGRKQESPIPKKKHWLRGPNLNLFLQQQSSPDLSPGRRRRSRFVDGTIAGLSRRVERAFFAEDLARANGLLQSLDPRVKVIGLLALLLDVAAARNLIAILVVFVIALLLALLSRVPLSTLATRIWFGALLFTGLIALPSIFITPGQTMLRLPLVGWPVTAQGLLSAVFLLARVETAATLSGLLILCTLWVHVLKALRVLGVPVVLIVILGMTHRYVFLLLQTTRAMFESRQSRMVGRMQGVDQRRLAAATAGVLLSRTLHLSNEVYLAMQSRGFRGEVYTLDQFRMRKPDWAALLVFLGLAVGLLWLGR